MREPERRAPTPFASGERDTGVPLPNAAAREHAADLGGFVAASPSSFHAVAEMARRLEAAGYRELHESEPWPQVTGRWFVVRDGALIAWRAPRSASPLTPLRIFGAHTDSPAFKLKPRPSVGSGGWLQVGVEVYGGGLLNSWLDRELELAGRLVTRDGRQVLSRTGPMLSIPQLAPHLDRSQNDALHLDRQRHLMPVWGLGPLGSADVLDVLARQVGIEAADVAGHDIVAVDTQPAREYGLGGQLFASARLDNLLSVHAGLTALLRVDASTANPSPADTHDAICLVAAFDHEEIGSQTRSGADGSFLADVATRISGALGAGDDERLRSWAASLFVSCDVGHSVNPNYPEKHDPSVRPIAGGGPMLKLNANQRYVTDAPGAAGWLSACERAGVPCQEFVSNNSSPCGSTIGPMVAARLGIRTVDVGVAILAMHSARETCATADPWWLTLAASEFFEAG